jgi:hypothetical protein
MPEYNFIEPSFNISDYPQCIRSEDFISMLPHLTLKADAIKLGVYCFVAGIIVGIVLQYLRQRYNQ